MPKVLNQDGSGIPPERQRQGPVPQEPDSRSSLCCRPLAEASSKTATLLSLNEVRIEPASRIERKRERDLPLPDGSLRSEDRRGVDVSANSRTDRTEFGQPARGKGSADRPPRGRLCVQDGCTTVLSTYNSSDHCWLHTPVAYRHPLSHT